MELKLKHTYQALSLAASALLLVFLMVAPFKEREGEWRRFQKRYQASTGQDLRIEIREIRLDPIHRIDRCSTCHLGMGDAAQKDQPLPLRTHSGTLLRDHPPSRFGCTLCHAGQGRAVDRKNAHARSRQVNWPFPLLSLDYVESSCGHCHLAIFGGDTHLEGTETFQRGLGVFSQEGCLGCHKARSVGGSLGPDLTVQGEKTRHEYDFSGIAGEHTVSNWLYSHFKDPEMVSPGSQMLAVNRDEGDIQALIVFTLGMAKPDLPFDYFSLPTLREFKGERELLPGPEVFLMICSACHGKKGEGKSYQKFKTGVPAVGSPDFTAVASAEFITFSLSHGRSGRQMEAWDTRFSGLSGDEILALAAFLRSLNPARSAWAAVQEASGDASAGQALYREHCSLCHGEEGKGYPTISIFNGDMLSAAPDSFLYLTLVKGRGSTAMPAWTRFSTQDMADVLSFLREREPGSGRSPIPPSPSGGDSSRGEDRYHYLCSRCHGLYGQGDTGPAILNPDFLRAAPDSFLQLMIALGRRGTAMYGWSRDVSDRERLSWPDIADVIAYLRSSSQTVSEVIYPGPSFGSGKRGAAVFQTRCGECHGAEGQGSEAPALNNQEFLNAATNGTLFATVSLGRAGTDMPAWGKGSETRPVLSHEERFDVLTFIRSWQRVVIKKRIRSRSSSPPQK